LNLEFPVVRKTLSTVNWPSFSWFERNFGLNTAVRTGYFSHFPGAAVAASETTTTTVAVSVATTVRISSVIKTHFVSPPLIAGIYIVKTRLYKIDRLKTKNWFLITDYTSLYFQLHQNSLFIDINFSMKTRPK
jgi:hypothetical protein